MFTGAEFKDYVIILAGNIFIVILIFRMISHWAKREWGELLTNFLIAVFIAWIVYSTDTFISFLQWLANKISGGQAEASGQLLESAQGTVQALAHTAPQLLTAGVI